MNNNYNPTPIDVSNVMLSAELEKLATLLAANVHDTWALGRIKEGWSYGPQREEAKKETPHIGTLSLAPAFFPVKASSSSLETIIASSKNIS